MTDLFAAPMPPATLEALRGSIAKWRAIVDGTGVDKGQQNCPLCLMFIINPDCAGCPVAAAADPLCGNTPYIDFDHLARPLPGNQYGGLRGLRATTPETRDAAQREVDFLISLLPAGELP